MLTIKAWPENERPRERLLKEGPSALSDAQLLAILLRTGTADGDALQLAYQLLNKFSSLSALIDVSAVELCLVKGIGPAKAAQIKAGIELGRRCLSVPMTQNKAFSASREVFLYFAPLFKALKKEQFKLILLNQKNRIMRELTISEGSLTETVVHPREVFQPAVADSAAAVIFVHNHPSGDPTPSPQDYSITKRLVAAGAVLGIPVLDHVVIGAQDYFSFADAGYIKNKIENALASEAHLVYGS